MYYNATKKSTFEIVQRLISFVRCGVHGLLRGTSDRNFTVLNSNDRFSNVSESRASHFETYGDITSSDAA